MRESTHLIALGGDTRRTRVRRERTRVSKGSDPTHPKILEGELRRANITLSAPSYVGICVTVGFFAFILPLSVGPVFAVFSGIVIGYELMTSYPRGRAARREQLIGEQLPLCLELLGQRMSSGEPVETAVMSMAQDLSAGPLADEMKLVMESVQTGMPVCDALLELPKRIRGGEIRAFVAALHTFAFGEFQSGQALVNYSQFMRTHRSIVTKMSRRVAVIRRMFAVALVVAIFLALGMDPLLPQGMIGLSLASLEMLRELGAMLVLVAVLMVGRMTGSQWWDGAHGE